MRPGEEEGGGGGRWGEAGEAGGGEFPPGLNTDQTLARSHSVTSLAPEPFMILQSRSLNRRGS